MRKFSLILFILSFNAFTQAPRLLTGFLSPKSTKSLSKTLEEDARLPSRLINDSAFIQKIKELNPQIKDFFNIMPSQRIYIELPYGTKLVGPTRPIDRIKTGFVKSSKQNDLISILKDDALLPENLLNDSDFIELTKTINPTIEDFSKIASTQK
ncbi:MAG: hypothetical protein KC493_17915, partial [Bacteriovoracaceae bacterium]|nr:hypothetical protein [Bacteriovoracaceae bacterium]